MAYGTEFRKLFLKYNPDKKIKIEGQHCTGVGTTKYWCEWTGDWTAAELVNFCDGTTGNFGGRIDNLKEKEDGTKSGIVCVYYD